MAGLLFEALGLSQPLLFLARPLGHDPGPLSPCRLRPEKTRAPPRREAGGAWTIGVQEKWLPSAISRYCLRPVPQPFEQANSASLRVEVGSAVPTHQEAWGKVTAAGSWIYAHR